MNRIYQGRIKDVELVESKKGPGTALNNWEDVIWGHHSLFQDAVNYYQVCLLAMATKKDNPLYKIRREIADADHPEYQVWTDFRRRGVTRRGLVRSIAPYMVPENENPTIGECFRAVRAGGIEDDKILNEALKELLENCKGDSAIQQQGRAILPMFCDPAYKGKYPTDKLKKDIAQNELALALEDPANTRDYDKVAGQLAFWMFANEMEDAPHKTGAEARDILNKGLLQLAQNFPKLKAVYSRLEQIIEKIPDTIEIPAPSGGSINKLALKLRFYAYLIFTHVERSALTLEVLRESLPDPEKIKKQKQRAEGKTSAEILGEDYIKQARGRRGYIFRGFTAHKSWNDKNKPSLNWKEFDIAAFKEALKALHQIEAKGAERDKECKALKLRHEFMRGTINTWIAGESEEDIPARVTGDPRIERLEALLSGELAMEYEIAEGERIEYGLQERTIRGFKKLRQIWRKVVRQGDEYSEEKCDQLLKALVEFQTENSETIGSVALYRELVERENWVIWQEADESTAGEWTECGFADDPLAALTEERDILERIKRLEEPVRLTPADPVYSGRQFYFSDMNKNCHDTKLLAVNVEIAMQGDDGLWRRQSVRVHYSAPRLLRDRLRGADQDLDKAGWLQPMMEALDPELSLPQDMSKSAVALMPVVGPSGQKRFLLNFPVSIETGPLEQALGRKAFGKVQFNGFGKGLNLQLRCLAWPTVGTLKKKIMSTWHDDDASFRCLAADLARIMHEVPALLHEAEAN